MVSALQLHGALGKWHVAILAADLGLWRSTPVLDVTPETWYERYGTSLPVDFQDALLQRGHVKTKEFQRWVTNLAELGRRGMVAYTEVAARVRGLASTLDPGVIPSNLTGSFAKRVSLLEAVLEDRSLAAAAAVISVLTTSSAVFQARHGSLTDAPVTWPEVAFSWDTEVVLCSGAPSSITLLTASGIHILDPHQGIRSYDLNVEEQVVWIALKSSFRKHVYVVGTPTRLIEVKLRDQCLECSCVATFPPETLPLTNHMDKASGYICWLRKQTPVALCLDSYAVVEDGEEVAALMTQVREAGTVAGCGRFVYEGGAVLASLPREQEIVAVVGCTGGCVDAFTKIGDWWRLVPNGTSSVVGLNGIADVRDAVANK
jgi:hypothetical protein